MNCKRDGDPNSPRGLAFLQALRTVPAHEFTDWSGPLAESGQTPPGTAGETSVLASEKEYRYLKAIADHPMQPSSAYSKLAGIRAASAGPLRDGLIRRGYIRSHLLDGSRRGRSTLLLEALPAGKDALHQYETQRSK